MGEPVCGSDGVTYGNRCLAKAACQLDGLTPGACTCKPNPGGFCIANWAPVCGSDGVTYGNQCKARLACKLDGSTPGACTCTPNPTPMCAKDFRPVCGPDGVTYGNKCLAKAESMATAYPAARNLCAAVITLHTPSRIGN